MKYPFFKKGSFTFFTADAIRQSGLDYPGMLNIEPTNDCNSNCVMCPRKKFNRPIGYMTMDLFATIINDIKKNLKKLKWLTLHKDGEPLLHPDLPKMIRYAKSQSAVEFIHFNTNAIALNEELAFALIDSDLDDLTLSIDGITNDTFQKVKRVDVPLELVVRNCRGLMSTRRKLGKKKPWVRAKIIDMPCTKNDIKDFAAFWTNVVDEVQVQKIHNAAGELESGVGQPCSSPDRYPCSLLWYSTAINWDGSVSPCCVDLKCETIFGNLCFQTLKDAFTQGPILRYRQKMLDGKTSELQPCSSCNVWKNGVNLFPQPRK